MGIHFTKEEFADRKSKVIDELKRQGLDELSPEAFAKAIYDVVVAKQPALISPEEGYSSPIIILIRVVLPAPFSPSIPIISPSSIFKLIFLRAKNSS